MKSAAYYRLKCRKLILRMFQVSVVGLCLLAVVGVITALASAQQVDREIRTEIRPKTYAELVALSPAQLEGCDVAVANLLCSEGLPGAEQLDVEKSLAVLDSWAARVQRETKRFLGLFQKDPAKFQNTEAIYQMQMLVTVVMQDFHAHYNSSRDSSPERPEAANSFFANAKDLFIDGLITEPHTGTCASMPVLYTAIGRRLGYPLKLVAAKSHLFVRWESADGKERFNIEGTNGGMKIHDDEYYTRFPRVITEEELKSGQYLRSLSPVEEVAAFLSIRGICLQVNRRPAEAKEAFLHAHRLMPKSKLYEQLANQNPISK